MTNPVPVLARELRRAPRALLRSPGYAFSVVLVFALGIGTCTTMWSAIHVLLLEALPYPQPERLVALYQQTTEDPRRAVAPANFVDWQRLHHGVQEMAAWSEDLHVVTGAGEPRRLDVAWVSTTFFDVLGVRAEHGRLFHRGETGSPAVLSHALAAQLGGSRVLGHTLQVDGSSLEVVGIAPPPLDFPATTQIWAAAPRDIPPLGLPMATDLRTVRDARYLGVVGRLAPGVSVEAARAELSAIAARLASAYPDSNAGNGATLVPLRADLGSGSRKPLLLLLGAATLVLLVGCLNVGGLLFARAARRQRAAALRVALGAGRVALAAPALCEALLLAAVGGTIGVLFAAAATPRLVQVLPQAVLGGREARLSLAVLGFAVAISVASALLAAALPALLAPRRSPATVLTSSRGALGPRRGIGRAALVVGQVAIAFVLLAGAGLLLRTLRAISAASPGFDASDRIALRLALPNTDALPRPARRQILAHAVALAADTPGVRAAGAALKLPLTGLGYSSNALVEGRAYAPGEAPDVCWRAVTPGYFATMGIPLLRGRAFADEDAGEAGTALINRTLASTLWPGQDPLGKRLRTGLDGESWVTVVGVVGDTPQRSLGQTVPEMYRPLLSENRFGAQSAALVVRTAPGFSMRALRERLRAASPLLVAESPEPLQALVAHATAAQHLLATLLGVFGGAALLLAGVGLYALLAFLVAERGGELGVRLALGARPRMLAWLVLRRGVTQVTAGAALGVAAALLALRLLAGWLYGVAPWDWASLGSSLAVLLVAALLAGSLPALRAARVPPASALRSE